MGACKVQNALVCARIRSQDEQMLAQLPVVFQVLSAKSLQSNVPLLRASPLGVQCQPVYTNITVTINNVIILFFFFAFYFFFNVS